MVDINKVEKGEFNSSDVVIYTIVKNNMIDEYLHSIGLEDLNQLSDEDFFEVSELSGYSGTLDEFEYDFNVSKIKIDSFRFKMIKGIKKKPYGIKPNKLL